jgi:hypothetical protein
MTHPVRLLPRDDSGRLSTWAWPGGYPIYYICADGGCLCPACANGDGDSIASPDQDDPQWQVIGAEVHWEGEPIVCDHCGKLVESAYGDYGDPEKDAS